MNQTVLLCTVGGSHQPIVTACRELRPDFVCFVCSGKDPGTRRPGSDIQITGKGLCIKAQQGDEKASLPNIPAQLGLKPDDQAALFYQRFGFIPSPLREQQLLLLLKDTRRFMVSGEELA